LNRCLIFAIGNNSSNAARDYCKLTKFFNLQKASSQKIGEESELADDKDSAKEFGHDNETASSGDAAVLLAHCQQKPRLNPKPWNPKPWNPGNCWQLGDFTILFHSNGTFTPDVF